MLHSKQISFNGGENWEELAAPEHPVFPECSTCRPSDSCKLHLHGPSSWHYGAGVQCFRAVYIASHLFIHQHVMLCSLSM